MCCLKDLVKFRQKLTFANNILLELEKINYPSMTLAVPTLFETRKQQVIAAGKVRDENINFESHRTSSMSRKKYKHNNRCYFQKFQAAIRYLAINATSKLNEYINKLNLPYWTPGCSRKGPMNQGLSFRLSVRKFSWDWLVSFF